MDKPNYEELTDEELDAELHRLMEEKANAYDEFQRKAMETCGDLALRYSQAGAEMRRIREEQIRRKYKPFRSAQSTPL